MFACYNAKQDAQNRRRMPWLSRITFAYMAGLLDGRGRESIAAREWQPQSRRRHPQPDAKHIRHQQRIHGGGVMAHT